MGLAPTGKCWITRPDPIIFNVVNVVIALAMKSAIQGDNQEGIDRLFDEANDTALVLSSVMRDVPVMSADKAYLLGLFRDCGMPILLQRYPQYAEVLREAAKRPEQSLTDLEDARLKTDHAVVGALMSRHWHLPEEIGTIILNHHRTRGLFGNAAWKPAPGEDNIRTVIAVRRWWTVFVIAYGRARILRSGRPSVR